MTAAARMRAVTRNRITAAIIAIVIVVIAFGAFLTATQERIVDQNTRYLEGTTLQTSRRVGDLLTNAQMMIKVVASSHEATMDSDKLDVNELPAMLRSTPFDHIVYSTKDGTVYDDRGLVEGLDGSAMFANGLEGESGTCTIDEPEIDKEGLVAFYTPMYYQGRVVGVLAGAYAEVHISEMITTYFFGEQTSTYLCDTEGNIVAASATTPTSYDNVLDLYGTVGLEGITLDELRNALANSEDMGFTYATATGSGTAYLMDIPDNNWMVLRSFPSSITNAMVTNATGAAVLLMLSIAGALALFVAVLLVQARRQSVQLLMEKQQATRIVDASTNLFQRLAMLDLEDGTYEYLKASGLLGKLPHEGDLATFEEFWIARAIEDEDREALRMAIDPDLIRKELVDGVPYLQSEYRISTSEDDPTPIWVQVSIICLDRDKRGVPTSALLAVQDVTDIKQQETASREALEEAYKAADQASKAKSDFLNSMSHDIRTPMNSIMGLTAIASMHLGDSERVKDCLQKITVASRHLLGLINEVLDMAKIESGKIALADEDFDLPETIESLLTIVHPQMTAKNQELKVDIASMQHEHVVGDPMRLQQVFVNIMGNAIKFTPEGGSISLHICEKPSRINGCGCYEFTFTDTGCGMDEEFVKRVFDPFSRAKDSRVTKVEGTGLGMSIVKSIVSLMNGTIDVESAVGVGSTFRVTVYLKLRDAKMEDLSELHGLPVLVADDDQDACAAAVGMLAEVGMEADYVMSGEEAVNAVRKAHEEARDYVAVILDWKMPGKSGIEAAREIRDIVADDVPIIILSAYDWSSIEQEARATGVDAFISKPLFRSRLVHVMQELLTDYEEDVFNEQKALEQCDCSGRRILLTEDNNLAAAIAEDIIGMTGAEVERAENGRESFEMLKGHEPGYYDLVFMDIQMPVMNGYEATQAIRGAAAERPDLAELPIIALSADAFNEDIQRARAAGMNAHMSKPMEIEALIKTLKEWLS